MYCFGDLFPEGLLGIKTFFVPIAHQSFFIVAITNLLNVGHLDKIIIQPLK
jgi:hypothetical protein